MSGYASRDKQLLSKIAIIDSAAIEQMTAGLNIPGAVETYLTANPPTGGLTINQIKSDTDIASAISSKHSNSNDHSNSLDHSSSLDHSNSLDHAAGSDNQVIPDQLSDLSEDVTHRTVTDTEKSTWNGKGSSNLVLGDLAANAYYGDKGKTAYDHSQAAHAPAGAEVNVNADWNSGSGDSQIMNKPSIPAAQVQTDWNAGSGMGQLLNKPTLSSARLVANLPAPVVTSGTTEKVLLRLQIPANNAVVGSTYRAWIIGNSSSTGTLIFKVRCGAGGTITDTIDWTAVTSAAQVANARAGFDVLITIRSATTIKAEGVGYAGAVQLPTTIAVPTTPAIVISGVWYISLTVICSSGTFTAQVGSIEEIK